MPAFGLEEEEIHSEMNGETKGIVAELLGFERDASEVNIARLNQASLELKHGKSNGSPDKDVKIRI